MREAAILVVENDPHGDSLTLKALRKHTRDESLVHLQDGDQALDFIFSKGKYEKHDRPMYLKVIFLGLNKSGQNNLKMLRQLKSDQSTCAVPVVILSPAPEAYEVAESYKLNVNSYVVKPGLPQECERRIEQIANYWVQHNLPVYNPLFKLRF